MPNKILRLVTIAVVLVSALAHGSPVPVRATVDWRSCAARPVQLPASRPVNPADIATVTATVADWRAAPSKNAPGVSAAVRWDDGREILTDAGWADRSNGRRILASTPFPLASISKSFTTAVALLLDACGILPLTTTAKSLVPYASVDPTATIKDLVRHRSGIGDWLNDTGWHWSWLMRHPNRKVTPATAVRNVAFGPRGTFNYSNSGFTLITLAAEAATGRPWRELLQTLLLDPLQLRDTGIPPMVGAARSHWYSRGRVRSQGVASWGPTPSLARVTRGAGDMMSSPRDLARFAELFWGNRLIEGERSLDVNGPALGGGGFFIYTYGSMVQRGFLGDLRAYGHTGGFPGTTTTLQRIPALGITIAVTIDGSGTVDNLANDLAVKILSELDDPALNPDGSARRTAADRGDPDPPDPPVALPGDVCGDPTPDPALGGDPLTSRWVPIGAAAGWTGAVTALAELPDGRIVAAGDELKRAAGTRVRGLAVWDPRSGTWSPFAAISNVAGAPTVIRALTVDLERKILYVGGTFRSVRGAGAAVEVNGVAQLNLTTGRWSAVGGGLQPAKRANGSAHAYSLSLEPSSGALAIGGNFARPSSARSANVAVWNPRRTTGGSWSKLGEGVDAPAFAVTIAEDGTVVTAGRFSDGLVSRWSPTLKSWSSIGDETVFSDVPTTLALDGDGTLIAGRGVGWYGEALQAYDAGTLGNWRRLGGGLAYQRSTPWVSTTAVLPNGHVAIGGYFAKASGALSPNLTVWNPSTDTYEQLGGGLPIEPDALAASTNATLIAATRIRSALPGGTGGRCISAWGLGAPGAPTITSVHAMRGRASVSWSADATQPAARGFIGVATARGERTRTCTAGPSARSCTFEGLVSGVRYTVRLRAWSAPAGPSPNSTSITVKVR